MSLRTTMHAQARAVMRTHTQGGLHIALAALLASAWVAILVGGQEAGGQEGHPQGADPGVIDAARTMLASTPVPDSQREALADGGVSYVEYEAAVFSTIACIEAAGLKILEQPHPDPSGKVLEYSFAAGMDLAEAERSNAISRACYKEHQAAIDIMWSAQNTPSQDVLAEAKDFLDALKPSRRLSVRASC